MIFAPASTDPRAKNNLIKRKKVAGVEDLG